MSDALSEALQKLSAAHSARTICDFGLSEKQPQTHEFPPKTLESTAAPCREELNHKTVCNGPAQAITQACSVDSSLSQTVTMQTATDETAATNLVSSVAPSPDAPSKVVVVAVDSCDTVETASPLSQQTIASAPEPEPATQDGTLKVGATAESIEHQMAATQMTTPQPAVTQTAAVKSAEVTATAVSTSAGPAVPEIIVNKSSASSASAVGSSSSVATAATPTSGTSLWMKPVHFVLQNRRQTAAVVVLACMAAIWFDDNQTSSDGADFDAMAEDFSDVESALSEFDIRSAPALREPADPIETSQGFDLTIPMQNYNDQAFGSAPAGNYSGGPGYGDFTIPDAENTSAVSAAPVSAPQGSGSGRSVRARLTRSIQPAN